MNEHASHDTPEYYDPTKVLTSEDEFCQWYLALHDFSMFSESEINALIEDVKPTVYPCVPLMTGSGFDVVYAEVGQVAAWFETISDAREDDC